MKLYAVVDDKSTCAEYFIASCDEDAMRIWYVMAASSKPMFMFLEEYHLEEVCELPQTRHFKESKITLSGSSLKRMIEFRKEKEDADKNEVSNRV